ncbi:MULTISPECIES: RNA polymerase sigma factor [unclassified Variovorax]|uniref:RNA polymerase sigma factor n=1 Tax=unclassified Variovorax TaxID=663243 RepID=UPI00257502DC|nr:MULTISPECIES: RNA polymerase sigma factor [unclassified Variovorax]MDM0087890.1 RNA polymerase sigma factor [Variovorax sp. J22G40]MDM0143854.1 RNA polymerase sigma factor [Variovorax sp. J2P1-31]
MAFHTPGDFEAACGDGSACAAPADARHGQALRGFLVTHYDQLQRKLMRHLGCADMASECLHDAWLRLGRSAISDPVQSPEAYIYRMACNVATDRARSNRAWQCAGDADEALAHFVDEAPGPEDIAAGRADLAAVERALQDLPRRHRAVLIALRIDEMARQDVASRHALSLRRLDTVLRQALRHCAEKARPHALQGGRAFEAPCAAPEP